MPELFIATKKDWKRHKVIRKQEPPRGRIPDGLTERESMERKLVTKDDRGSVRADKRSTKDEPIYKTRVERLCKRVEVNVCYS